MEEDSYGSMAEEPSDDEGEEDDGGFDLPEEEETQPKKGKKRSRNEFENMDIK